MNVAKFSKTVKMATILAAIGLFVLIVVIIFQYAKIGSLKSEKISLQVKLEKLYDQESTLEDAIKNRNSLAFAEEFARENLGMIEDGDNIFDFKK